MKKKILFTLLSIYSIVTFSQDQGVILLIPNNDCKISINGEEQVDCQNGKPFKIQLAFGEHFIQANNGKDEISKIVEITDSKQKVIKLDFINQGMATKGITTNKKIENQELESILISEQELKLYGGLNELVPEVAILNEENHQYLYLAKGDRIRLNGKIKNKKGKFFVKLYSYPDLNVVFSKKNLRELNNAEVNIRKKGIFVLEIGSSAIFDKTLKMKIERIPATKDVADMNTNVEKKYKFETIQIGKTFQYVNSTSNETWKGGTNEVLVPVRIPQDAIEWYYSFAASRNEAELKKGMNNVSLLGQLTETLNGIDPTTTAINIGLNILTSPPGADYCDVYLVDHTNSQLFSQDLQFSYIMAGSRENLKSSTIKVKCCTDKEYYLGIQNRDSTHGIHVGVEIVAIKRIGYLEPEVE